MYSFLRGLRELVGASEAIRLAVAAKELRKFTVFR